MAKLQAYSLQDNGLDTIESNHALGFTSDSRDFGFPIAILHDFGVRRVRLLSNNPEKYRALVSAGIEVVERISCGSPQTSILFLICKPKRRGWDTHLHCCKRNRCAASIASPYLVDRLKPLPRLE